MVASREDVERLFCIDRLPDEADPRYDGELIGTVEVPLVDYLLEDLRSSVVQSIVGIKARGAPPVKPFTLMVAHEAMACRDVMLDAFLVHPDFVPLCANLVRPFFGKVAKIFAHEEVPPAEIYALAEPTYLGVIPVKYG